MFFPEPSQRVWLYCRPTDMRKSFDGLMALVENELKEDPLSGQLFVFINRRKTHMKVLYFDRTGYCIWSKRLEQGQFNYRAQEGKKYALGWLQWKLLLEGVALKKVRQYKRFGIKK